MFDVLIRSLDAAFGYGIWIISKEEESIGPRKVKVLRLGPMTWEEIEVGYKLPMPTFDTSTREGDLIFEKFIGALKGLGFGRDKISVESGELKATKEHLADMKRLVFTPPAHFAPKVIEFGNSTSGLSMVGGLTPGRATMIPIPPYDTVSVRASRVRRAAKQCSNARGVLAELFPEVFGPGWEYEAD